ncbi:TetR/AcrR family transcriptional regulator [Novosphingobium panipatense]
MVHYYFPTTDDLLVEVSRQGAAQSDRMIEEALASEDPLRALWDFFIDTSRVAMALEFMALANHRPAVREYMAQHSEEMRARQVEILKRLLGDRLSRLEGFDAAGLSVVLAGIGRAIVMEHGLGVTTGHAEAIRIVEGWLDKLAPDRAAARGHTVRALSSTARVRSAGSRLDSTHRRANMVTVFSYGISGSQGHDGHHLGSAEG